MEKCGEESGIGGVGVGVLGTMILVLLAAAENVATVFRLLAARAR